MVDVKQAIANAKEYAHKLLDTEDLLLEEVHSLDDKFEITLSFPARPFGLVNPSLFRGRPPREYKTFEVDKESGLVLGMSIRVIV